MAFGVRNPCFGMVKRENERKETEQTHNGKNQQTIELRSPGPSTAPRSFPSASSLSLSLYSSFLLVSSFLLFLSVFSFLFFFFFSPFLFRSLCGMAAQPPPIKARPRPSRRAPTPPDQSAAADIAAEAAVSVVVSPPEADSGRVTLTDAAFLRASSDTDS